METRKRSIMKSITWRVVGVVLLGGIAYAVTRDWKEMSVITAIFHTVRMILYYYHERVWLRIKWGRIRHPLDEIQISGKLEAEDLEAIRAKLRAMGYIE